MGKKKKKKKKIYIYKIHYSYCTAIRFTDQNQYHHPLKFEYNFDENHILA